MSWLALSWPWSYGNSSGLGSRTGSWSFGNSSGHGVGTGSWSIRGWPWNERWWPWPSTNSRGFPDDSRSRWFQGRFWHKDRTFSWFWFQMIREVENCWNCIRSQSCNIQKAIWLKMLWTNSWIIWRFPIFSSDVFDPQASECFVLWKTMKTDA